MDQKLARAIFAPRTIAIVGASADPSKTSSRPLSYLLKGGFRGDVYPINPNAPEISGRKAYASIRDVPATPDLAFVLLPTDAAIDAVASCGERGVSVAVVLASGFSEAGTAGIAREARLLETARKAGIRIVGPSSLGLVNLHEQLVLTGNAAFAEAGSAPGGVFCASQSGSMIGALLSRGNAKGIGFAGMVSVGGEVDLSLGALCEATLDDPNVTSYMLFLESLRDANGLRRFAVGAAERGKPVVALKLGRSSAAAEIAVSHTGALAGEDDVADAFLADCGIARVETLEGFLEAGALLQKTPVRRRAGGRPTVGVVTTTGGGAALVVDQLGIRDIDVQAPDEATLAAIRAAGANAVPSRIVDLTLAGVRYEVMKGALEAMLASPAYDLVVAVVGSSSRFQPELAVKPIVDIARAGGRLAAFLVPEAPQALAMLVENGVPCFRTPEACADVIAAALKRRPARALDTGAHPAGSARLLDEFDGYKLLDTIGIHYPPTVAVPVADPRVEADLYPAAVKVLHPDIAHKTDVGGVVLGVRSDADLRAAAGKIVESVKDRAPGIAIDRLLVQKMASGALGEALVGYRIDPQVGPVVVLAGGGVTTEIYKDRTIRIAPVDVDTAMEMIEEVRGLAVLKGFRGKPKGDLAALADTVVALSRLAERPELGVVELEVNPLLVMPQGEGVLAVDALVRVRR